MGGEAAKSPEALDTATLSSEEPRSSPPTLTTRYGDVDTITTFDSNDEKLNAVWELGRENVVFVQSFYESNDIKNS